MAAQDARPAYEAASVKSNNSGDGHTGVDGYQGRIVFTNMPLQRLIAGAYGIGPFQVEGPAWLASERFDVVATYAASSTPAERLQMLRGLLEDRFKLAVHRESKQEPGYALVAAKNGFKLKPAESGENETQHAGSRIQSLNAKKTSMATLAGLIARYMGQPVVDRTGIEGVFDFELRWSTDEAVAEAGADMPPSIFTALEESLGLRLQAQKVPVEIVVVDHVERTPTDN